jgi:hypothetical protein
LVQLQMFSIIELQLLYKPSLPCTPCHLYLKINLRITLFESNR